MSYTQEPWFAILADRCRAMKHYEVAALLGIGHATLSIVLNSKGKYGSGEASTSRIADKVIHTFGQYACPYLTADSGDGEPVVITADRCRAYAWRGAPTSNPREMQHWQACQKCPHKAACAPAPVREVKPRKPKGAE